MAFPSVNSLRAAILAVGLGGLPFTASAQTFDAFWQFGGGQDGKSPVAALLYSGGKLYGTTTEGGTGDGTIFVVTPKKSREKVLHAFSASIDGSDPKSALIEVGSLFYGTTSAGGPNSGYGTVFAFNPKTSALSTLHTFTNGADGADPLAGLLYSNGSLYGTALKGGAQGKGTVFSINIATGALTTLYAFTGGADGAYPASALILNGGLLMGTSSLGGASGDGTVYAVDPATGAETVLHSFDGTDGSQPNSSLIAIGSVVYGTTFIGGFEKIGVVFSVDTTSLQETTLHAMTKKDGQNPVSGLLNVSNTLYGTAERLGDGAGGGTVFSCDLTGGKFEIVYHFTGSGDDGGFPEGNLILHGKTIYGTASGAGEYQGGTAFEIQLP